MLALTALPYAHGIGGRAITSQIDFSRRADLTAYPERMDLPCTGEELAACLRSIARVNQLTGAYRPTLAFLDGVLPHWKQRKGPLHIVDVGAGYGDFLRRIHLWAHRRGVSVVLTGIDLNADAVAAARARTLPGVATFLQGDALAFAPAGTVDVVVSSLLMHHLEDAQIVALLGWMERTARLGWFVNDLHRQPFPYRAFRLLARLLPLHPFAKHDGAVSILRSFRRADWERLTAAAGLLPADLTIEEHRPARLCVARLRP